MIVLISILISLVALGIAAAVTSVLMARARDQKEKQKGMHLALKQEMEKRLHRFGPAPQA